MSDQDVISDEVQDLVHALLEGRRILYIHVRDPGQVGRKCAERMRRPDEELQALHTGTVFHDDPAELDDVVITGGQAGRLQVEYAVGAFFQHRIIRLIDDLKIRIDHVHLHPIQHLHRRFPLLVDRSQRRLCLREGLYDHMIRAGDRIHPPFIRRLDELCDVTDPVHLREVGMNVQLDPLFLRRIPAHGWLHLLDVRWHEHQIREVRIHDRLSIGLHMIAFFDLCERLFGQRAALKALHDDRVVIIADVQRLQALSVLEGRDLALKDVSADLHIGHAVLQIADVHRHIILRRHLAAAIRIGRWIRCRRWRCLPNRCIRTLHRRDLFLFIL